ncbi:MBOAT family O-acyltransferase [Atlantibacter subterraneus]|uniref:MBOAT family O-acyltransferase n=1 Tax=Atlantibacter subterraneus TaxID=255519 RepID=UPI00289A259F|nr:MBOAT family O-acyltransferase [Atlantibacter subterranea]
MNLFSLEFIGFFLVLFFGYWLVAPRPGMQNLLLLCASYIFVIWSSPLFAGILLGYSIIIYGLGYLANKWINSKWTIALAWLLVVLMFITFKYYGALREALILPFDLPVLNILMPLGLSFYLFNSLSFMVSIAKRQIALPTFLDALLYMSFFPTLVAGPINRASQLLPQLDTATPRRLTKKKRAFFLITLGIIKIFFLSSALDENYISNVFSAPQDFDASTNVIAVYAWAWHIYFNFSGYTNLVTGISLLLGIQIAKNFDHPYLATNPENFWKRWHISLSEFIKDYIYIPLGGNRCCWLRAQCNIFAAMTLSGIWHGAGYNFIVWGMLHGLGLIVYKLIKKILPFKTSTTVTRAVGRVITFHFICFTWIFFRAADWNTAWLMIDKIRHLNDWTINTPFIVFNALLIFYPALVAVRDKLAAASREIEWYWMPVPVVLSLAIAFFFAPGGIPGVIYAAF